MYAESQFACKHNKGTNVCHMRNDKQQCNKIVKGFHGIMCLACNCYCQSKKVMILSFYK